MNTTDQIVTAIVAEAERIYGINSSPLEARHVSAILAPHFDDLERLKEKAELANKLARTLQKVVSYPYIPQGMVAMIEKELE